jgi:hypothetical protein
MGQPAMGGTSSLCVGVGPRGFTRKARTSRMNREIHVRICGGLEVRFLRSTRRRSDVKGEAQVGSTSEGESTDAGHRDGLTCSSAEVPVMGMERRGWVIWPYTLANQ